VGMSGKMLCSFLLSNAQLDYFGCGLFFSLNSDSCSVLAFQKQTSFGFVMLTLWEAWNEFFRCVPSGPLSGELFEVVFVLHWDARSLRVLLAPLVSCHKELCVLWPRVSLRLLSMISSCCIRPALLRTCPTLLFVV
jgi:hypothetical protein